MILNSQINTIANREFGRETAPPENYYVGLLLDTPKADGSNVIEVSPVGTAYVRMKLENNKNALSIAFNGKVSNTKSITFPVAAAPWGIITDVGIFDAATGGNLLYVTTQGKPKDLDQGDIAFFNEGDIEFTVEAVN